MTSNQFLTASFLDILFENRNKEYGAYSIRKAYPKHLMKAIGLMLLLVIAFSFFVNSRPNNNQNEGGLFAHDTLVVDLEPYHEKEQPREAQTQRTVAAQPETRPDFVPTIVEEVVEHPVPDRTDTTIYNPGAETKPATGSDGADFIQAEAGTVTTITPEHQSAPEPETPVIHETADVMPEFPGGTDAWRNYLQRMLRVPDDLETGDRKTVRIRFVVNATGEITDMIVVQSAGAAFDKEVLRVIAKMPKWKPGKQAGKPVAVYYTQPVTFTAPE
ncbi:MAG: TonB family protein [Chitinophagaceae bacterium]|nr:TonB family protein [Chitinophagaceae bacterium]